ncbi:MAG: hypothetical protein Q8N05_10420 [Bacteroidota bacterium]|nr:hypothetical protein [Bacteroidota bacterium]
MTTPRKIPFKPYSPKQAMLLPPSLDEMVAANHPVRVVDRVVDQTDIHPLISTYKGFRRFMLRGRQKVEIETGLIALAPNFILRRPLFILSFAQHLSSDNIRIPRWENPRAGTCILSCIFIYYRNMPVSFS